MTVRNYKKQIVDYLRKNLKKGYTKESLKWALINQGHSKLEIEDALKKLEQEMANQAPVLKTKPEIKYEIVQDDTSLVKEKRSLFKRWFS